MGLSRERLEGGAPAQEPRAEVWTHGRLTTLASLSIQGVNQAGKREEVEQWMEEANIDIMVLQETRTKHNTRENRKHYTWYFSGEGGREKDGQQE